MYKFYYHLFVRGEMVIKPAFDNKYSVSFHYGLALSETIQEGGFIYTAGEIIIPLHHYEAKSFCEGLSDSKGNVVIQTIYTDIFWIPP